MVERRCFGPARKVLMMGWFFAIADAATGGFEVLPSLAPSAIAPKGYYTTAPSSTVWLMLMRRIPEHAVQKKAKRGKTELLWDGEVSRMCVWTTRQSFNKDPSNLLTFDTRSHALQRKSAAAGVNKQGMCCCCRGDHWLPSAG